MRREDLESLPELEDGLTPKTILRACDCDDPSEKEALAQLLKAAFTDEAWTLERLDRELICDPNVKSIFVFEEDGVLTATASVLLAPETMPDTGIVHWVASHPDWRGRQLGYRVTLATLWEFRRLGCKDSLLRTGEHRLAAIRTYLKLGFVPEYAQPADAEIWQSVYQNLALRVIPAAEGLSQ